MTNENFNYLHVSKKEGTFLEDGAFDGEEASVSLALELHHGWTGILVEPVPWIFSKLKAKGPFCFKAASALNQHQ